MDHEDSLFDQFGGLIGQYVRVALQDGTWTPGVLYCIDPETDHVAMLCEHDAASSVKIVLAHNVRGLEKDESESVTLAALREAHLQDVEEPDMGDLVHRREQLGEFLNEQLVSFEVAADGSFQVLGRAATLREPYRAVECADEQLLRRLQQLLTQFEAHASAT